MEGSECASEAQKERVPECNLDDSTPSTSSSRPTDGNKNMKLIVLTPAQLEKLCLVNIKDGKRIMLPIKLAPSVPSTISTVNQDFPASALHKETSGRTRQELKSTSAESSASCDVHPLVLYNWNLSLSERGFIRCTNITCNYIGLSLEDMTAHHKMCTGAQDSNVGFFCNHCNGMLSTSENLKRHVEISHSTESKAESCREWKEKREKIIQAVQSDRTSTLEALSASQEVYEYEQAEETMIPIVQTVGRPRKDGGPVKRRKDTQNEGPSKRGRPSQSNQHGGDQINEADISVEIEVTAVESPIDIGRTEPVGHERDADATAGHIQSWHVPEIPVGFQESQPVEQRGPPAECSELMVNSAVLLSRSEPLNESDMPTGKQPKKRGRKPKQPELSAKPTEVKVEMQQNDSRRYPQRRNRTRGTTRYSSDFVMEGDVAPNEPVPEPVPEPERVSVVTPPPDIETLPVKRGRGRPRKILKCTEEGLKDGGEPRKKRPDGGEPTEKRPDGGEPREKGPDVTCAKCKEKMVKSAFIMHNMRHHNNIANMEGDPEVPESEHRKLMLASLAAVRFVICELCNKKFISYLGWQYHIKLCGKSLEERKEQCDQCGRWISKTYFAQHQSSACRSLRQVALDDSWQEDEPLIESLGRGCRAAATKARSKIQEVANEVGASGVKEEVDKEDSEFDLVIKKDVASLFLKPSKSGSANNALIGSWKKEIRNGGQATCRYPNCTYKSSSVDAMKSHYLQCEKKIQKDHFRCKVCPYISKEEDDMMQHITKAHQNVMDGSDSESDGYAEETEEDIQSDNSTSKRLRESKAPSNRKGIGTVRFPFLQSERFLYGGSPLQAFTSAAYWTSQFQVKNFSKHLFSHLTSLSANWTWVKQEQVVAEVPLVCSSVQFRVQEMFESSQSKEWISLALFEGRLLGNVPTFFCGGPVWSMAWCPLPLLADPNQRQFLALSCPRSVDTAYNVCERYSENTLIQIWDVGKLTTPSPSDIPKLVLGIIMEGGPVWCLEWCPSGCYDFDSTKKPVEALLRLGLLAAACGDGKVRIYSICQPHSLPELSDGSWPIFKKRPDIVLEAIGECGTSLMDNYQCSRISWFKGKGHGLIAGGFSNGVIAVWDLATESPLLKMQDGSTTIYHPFLCFRAHYGLITALTLWPHLEGRYLMTGSMDRQVKCWDLEDTSQPLFSNKRGNVTNGHWPMHWVTALTTYDDTFGLGHSNTVMTPICNFGSKLATIFPQNSVVWGFGYSEWLNSMVHSTASGEVMLSIASQLLSSVDTAKTLGKRKMMVCCAELESLSNSDELPQPIVRHGPRAVKKKEAHKAEEKYHSYPRTYDEMARTYGLSIQDYPLHNMPRLRQDLATKRGHGTEQMAMLPVDMYPMTSVNCVGWNPNLGSHLWLASGYQCGLVRLTCMRHINTQSCAQAIRNAADLIQRSMGYS